MEIRIGILQCDHVDPVLLDRHGDYQEMFADLVQTQDSHIEISVYDLIADQFPGHENSHQRERPLTAPWMYLCT